MPHMLKNILSELYKVRYSQSEEHLKGVYWKILCEEFLQKFIKESDTVMDIAAGHCEFINNIKCRRKFAVDIDRRIKKYAGKNVRVVISSAENLPRSFNNLCDAVFVGCFLEHLPSKDAVIAVFKNIKRILKSGGRLMILNPNIRFSTATYWDYFDHLTPVSDRSVSEVLKALGFQIEVNIPRFVPNTIKDSLPKSPTLVKLYLKLPFLFPIFGKQMFIVARKKN
ncbi:hypothetical protein A2W14_02835 [Candidatus Gottesmanbacteria bacterium RBG_16_37_8]|uniref:Methyltransferase type 11 domain-containing protein n=1 Tax=Candidatus Gottesmanbacteria bacterium RBG_16_37_8 TaxID=1798371 RepID=A0A1F5YTQ9_9BACT|nr:MAG: hypothetical protein A2W14_02835 [Candidatus Gottesmanbacteria bacterium RBG_16_37_8]